MVSNRKIITTNSHNWLFAKLSYPCDSSRNFGTGQDYLISIIKQDGQQVNITTNCDRDCTCQQYTKITNRNLFVLKTDYINKTLLFTINHNAHKVKPGNYSVSLKIKDYLSPCEYANITIKS